MGASNSSCHSFRRRLPSPLISLSRACTVVCPTLDHICLSTGASVPHAATIICPLIYTHPRPFIDASLMYCPPHRPCPLLHHFLMCRTEVSYVRCHSNSPQHTNVDCQLSPLSHILPFSTVLVHMRLPNRLTICQNKVPESAERRLVMMVDQRKLPPYPICDDTTKHSCSDQRPEGPTNSVQIGVNGPCGCKRIITCGSP